MNIEYHILKIHTKLEHFLLGNYYIYTIAKSMSHVCEVYIVNKTVYYEPQYNHSCNMLILHEGKDRIPICKYTPY